MSDPAAETSVVSMRTGGCNEAIERAGEACPDRALPLTGHHHSPDRPCQSGDAIGSRAEQETNDRDQDAAYARVQPSSPRVRRG